MNVIHDYFNKWYIKINKIKTVSTVFRLDNHHANQTRKIRIGSKQLHPESSRKYLEVTLDRTLTYEKHIEKAAQKLKTRNSILKKLSGTNWGAHQTTLRTLALTLCNNTAEYCGPVWERSKHKENWLTMRILSGTLKSTPTVWLPIAVTIAPPHFRRQELTQNTLLQLENVPNNIPIKKIIATAPNTARLKSRKPFYRILKTNFDIQEAWKTHWLKTDP